MTTRLLYQTLICGICICLPAAEFYTVTQPADADHLVPIRVRAEYEDYLSKQLFLTDGDFGRMLVRPSFQPEFCLSAHAQISDALIRKHGERYLVPDEEKGYVLTVTSASTSLWNALETRKTNEVRISRVDRTISLDLAAAIQRVWGKTLHLTHYPSGTVGGADGVKYQFSVWVRGLGMLEGETWSPQRGLPAALVSIGDELVTFVRQDGKGRPLTEQELVRRLKEIESKIPKA